MRTSELVRCERLACSDVDRESFAVPDAPLNPDTMTTLVVADAAPPDPALVHAFRAAGEDVETLADLASLGVYVTTAIKCGRTRYAISVPTIRACARLLEVELGLFPLARSLLLLGDVAIRTLNAVARLNGEPRVVPAGATYRLRGGDYRFRGMRVFPSYLYAGTDTRQMLVADVAAALAFSRRRLPSPRGAPAAP
jgi:hypothetical protein